MRGHLIDMEDEMWEWVGTTAASYGKSRAAFVRGVLDDRRTAELEARFLANKELVAQVDDDWKHPERLTKRIKASIQAGEDELASGAPLVTLEEVLGPEVLTSVKERIAQSRAHPERLVKRRRKEPTVVVPPGGAITMESSSTPGDGPGEPCPHPKESRHVLGWGTLCGKCGGKVR